MENLLLPRRERLFNNGGKLHFQNFSALFQGALSTSFPSGKYHCKAKSLSKTISRLRHIIAKGNKVSIPGDASHTALLKSHCRGRQCSLLCLFAPFSPRKYKSILRGFYNMVSLPGDASYASLLTNRLSQAAVGCLMLAYSFSPRVHSIPRGPRFGNASQ